MKESNEPGVVAILDTMTECRVVKNAIDDSAFIRDHPVIAQTASFTISRFMYETHSPGSVSETPYGPYEVPEMWLNEPEFKVREDDVEFVAYAARRTLEQRGLDRLLNSISGQANAASQMRGLISRPSELKAV